MVSWSSWSPVATMYSSITHPMSIVLICLSLLSRPRLRTHSTPKGLEDVSTYPTLFAELLGDGWTMEDLTKLAGKNFLRVLADVEALRDKMKQLGIKPSEDIPNFRSEDPYNCTSS